MSGGKLPDQWWEQCAGVIRFRLKPEGETIRGIIDKLDEIKDWGFDAIWMGVPYHGGIQYSGLDVVDFYSIDPAIGTMADLRELIQVCHEKELAIVPYFNVGYAAMEFPAFAKACDDVRAGIDSPEARWFLWSDTGTEEMDRSHLPYFRNDLAGYWHYSDRAGKYYWVKWAGRDREVDMPQFNFGDPAWQEECKRVMTFWMETGVDGVVIDAVNWYINCTWEINNATMTDIVHQYPNKLVQPEGGGGFWEDPVPWITEGRYNCLQDYLMSCWWRNNRVIERALVRGNPDFIEEILRSYRDRVVAAGGVCWVAPSWTNPGSHRNLIDLTPAQKLLHIATVTSIGEVFVGRETTLTVAWPPGFVSKIKEIIRAVGTYPALQAVGARRKLQTNNDAKYYAFMRTSKDGDQEMLVVLNFQEDSRLIRVKLNRPAKLTEIFTGKQLSSTTMLETAIPPYGYRFYLVER